jgi:hypothetical protein
MDWAKVTPTNDGIKIPNSWLYVHYYEALTALFRVENALRMFVYVVLKDNHKSRWAELQIGSDEGATTTLGAIAKRRLAQDERFGYLGYRIASPLMHLTTGELIRVIFADSYWPMFAEYFPASKEIARTKLEEIGNIRNAVAHFRPIKSDDVEVVKQNANQVLSRVEDMLISILVTTSIVPTNTKDAWYQPLKQIRDESAAIAFSQSADEKWIQVSLIYTSPILDIHSNDEYRSWRVLTLNAPNLLKACDGVLENVIYAAEELPYFDANVESPKIQKIISFVFSRSTLSQSFESIERDLTSVLALIAKEAELIKEDDLARGEIVRVVRLHGTKQGTRFRASTGVLSSRVSPDDPSEYWATLPSGGSDFVTDTRSYPWMPTEVSELGDDEVPF